MSEPAYRANTPAVAFELFSDDAVLVDFDRGHYYSLNATGRDAWEVLAAGAATATDLARRWSALASPETETTAAAAFLARLAELGLIVPAEAPAPRPPFAGPRRAFAPPKVDVFKDLEDLLLLDPIHDVAADGWPRAADAP